MLSSSTDFREVFQFAPEWEPLLRNWDGVDRLGMSDFLNRVGAKAIFLKATHLAGNREGFIRLLRDHYYLPILQKMLQSNQNLRRFLSQRYVAPDDQKSQGISLAVEVAAKMEGVLIKQLAIGAEDGFKVLLPAYMQRTVHNAVIDYIRLEATWEKSTLQDVYLDPEQDDPRTSVADDIAVTPENQVLNTEQVSQLNQLRYHLVQMLKESATPKEPLMVLDCMFGLGLTPHSTAGQEMTMRECCEKLSIQAETMARRIARCQVLLDKGLEMVRQRIYKQLPGIAECWQRGLNVNTSSRRELTQQLGMTEGEIERLIKGRQFANIEELINTGVIKANRLPELKHKGATAAFVPIELNSSTARDIQDILGLTKEQAQKLVSERPFKDLNEIIAKGLISKADGDSLGKRGGVVKSRAADSRRIDLNRAPLDEIHAAGVDRDTATLISKVRPFLTWSELEEAIGSDNRDWTVLRQKFFLGIVSG